MNNILKISTKISLAIFILLITISCGFISEKLTALKEEVFKEKNTSNKNTNSDGESNDNIFSTENVIFYNKYTSASNSVTDAIDRVQKSYLSMIPEVDKVKNNSYLSASFFVSSVENLESVLKDQNRSLFDDGELSQLKTDNASMKSDLKESFGDLLANTETYYETAKKISRYYDSKIYEENSSLIRTYDEEIKLKYKDNLNVTDEFLAVLNSYKPVIKIRNPDDFSNNEEKSVIILLNAYGKILETAEKFNTDFKRWNRGDDLTTLKNDIEELRTVYEAEKRTIMEFDFPQKTKFMKYSFEDYFEKMLTKFIENTEKFFKTAENKNAKEWEYTNAHSSVTSYYNYFVQAYNTNVEVIQTTSKSFNLF